MPRSDLYWHVMKIAISPEERLALAIVTDAVLQARGLRMVSEEDKKNANQLTVEARDWLLTPDDHRDHWFEQAGISESTIERLLR